MLVVRAGLQQQLHRSVCLTRDGSRYFPPTQPFTFTTWNTNLQLEHFRFQTLPVNAVRVHSTEPKPFTLLWADRAAAGLSALQRPLTVARLQSIHRHQTLRTQASCGGQTPSRSTVHRLLRRFAGLILRESVNLYLHFQRNTMVHGRACVCVCVHVRVGVCLRVCETDTGDALKHESTSNSMRQEEV